MKKLLIAALMSLTLISSIGANIVSASSNDTETIVVSASSKSNSNKYRIYKLRDEKMVATKKNVSISNKKGIVHWKAEPKKINQKTWWKIGKNQYLKSSRVEVINVKRSKDLGIKITNYAN